MLAALRTHRSARWLTVRRYAGYEGYATDATTLERLHAGRAEAQANLANTEDDIRLPGYCHCCRRESVFVTPRVPAGVAPNWRETLACEGCGLNSRLRASAQLFEQHARPWPLSRIYATEHTTPFFAWLRTRYPRATGSEFSDARVPAPKRVPPHAWEKSCRREDVTALSFPDRCFRAVLSFDVLEHVPDYPAALREFRRVLRPGGWIMLSAPFIEHNRETLVRARVRENGEIEHLLPPEYHGDPVSEAGCLCYYHFGWDLLDAFRAAGFSGVRCLFYWSMRLGYLGNQQLIVARRPRRLSSRS